MPGSTHQILYDFYFSSRNAEVCITSASFSGAKSVLGRTVKRPDKFKIHDCIDSDGNDVDVSELR